MCLLTVLSDAPSCLCRASTSASNRTLTLVEAVNKTFLILTNSPLNMLLASYRLSNARLKKQLSRDRLNDAAERRVTPEARRNIQLKVL